MTPLQLVFFILETAFAIIKAKISGAKVDIPDAIVRIVRAGYQLYEAEVGQPLDVAKVRPFEPLV